MQQAGATRRDDGGAWPRRFNSFRELAEFLKAEESRANNAGEDRMTPRSFNSFRKLGETLKREENFSKELSSRHPDIPDDVTHITLHIKSPFAESDFQGLHEGARDDQRRISGRTTGGNQVAVIKDEVNPDHGFPSECGNPDAKPGKNTAYLTNHSKTPIPYKPEKSSVLKYCKEGETCAVDAIYTPSDSKSVKKAIKVPNSCDIVINKDNSMKTTGKACHWPFAPRVVDEKFLTENKWPNPYTGYCWDGEIWEE